MIKVTFIEHGGTPHTIDIPEGMSLMQAAVNHNIPGIDADCGGSMTCGTCRVCIPLDAQGIAGEQSSLEQQMLEFSGLGGGGHPVELSTHCQSGIQRYATANSGGAALTPRMIPSSMPTSNLEQRIAP